MRLRRWSELSRVERVDVYTRQSLHLLLWLFCVIVLGSVLTAEIGTARMLLLVAGALVVTALGAAALGAVVRRYPQVHPLPWRHLTALVVAAVAYVAAAAPTSEGDARGAVVMVATVNVVAALSGIPDHRVSLALVVGAAAVFGVFGGGLVNVVAGAFVALTIVFSVRASLWLYGIVAELDDARQAQARLAVAEERLRFSRDVHDVLGRRLSTIAVQAELAATLAERGDERAGARMLEVRGIAHDALAEARELARGYRPTDLATELEGARSLLRSAGIEVRVEVDVVPRGWHEAAGWVVRESVTNVLRHSAAREVVLTYADEVLRVENDGVRETGAPPGEGSGLHGLRERLGALGATLDVGLAGGRWSLAARLPGAGPLSTTTPGRASS